MTDNRAALQADEFHQGLHALSILHETILPNSPYQNAKQESFGARRIGTRETPRIRTHHPVSQ